VIHGKRDEVINFKNGCNLVEAYEKYNKKCMFIQPPKMSHNNY
jgi:predicted esterase